MLLNLKAMRIRRGLKQKEVAQLMGISIPSYNRKEVGKSEFRHQEINKLLKILDCKYEDIFFEE